MPEVEGASRFAGWSLRLTDSENLTVAIMDKIKVEFTFKETAILDNAPPL